MFELSLNTYLDLDVFIFELLRFAVLLYMKMITKATIKDKMNKNKSIKTPFKKIKISIDYPKILGYNITKL